MYRPALFCKSGWNLLDAVLVALALILAAVQAAGARGADGDDGGAVLPGAASSSLALARGALATRALATALRALRAARAARLLFRAGRGSQLAARHLTGRNKKRFVDLAEGFDLDLTCARPSCARPPAARPVNRCPPALHALAARQAHRPPQIARRPEQL